ncbi:hypothetical protein AMTRI_Chr04g188020 [Amborella trichopoda]
MGLNTIDYSGSDTNLVDSKAHKVLLGITQPVRGERGVIEVGNGGVGVVCWSGRVAESLMLGRRNHLAPKMTFSQKCIIYWLAQIFFIFFQSKISILFISHRFYRIT